MPFDEISDIAPGFSDQNSQSFMPFSKIAWASSIERSQSCDGVSM